MNRLVKKSLEAEIEDMTEEVINALIKGAQDHLAAKRSLTKINPSIQENTAIRYVAGMLGDEKINAREQFTLNALICYLEDTQKMKQSTMQALLKMEFNVEKIEDIHRKDLQTAIELLLEFQVSGGVN